MSLLFGVVALVCIVGIIGGSVYLMRGRRRIPMGEQIMLEGQDATTARLRELGLWTSERLTKPILDESRLNLPRTSGGFVFRRDHRGDTLLDWNLSIQFSEENLPTASMAESMATLPALQAVQYTAYVQVAATQEWTYAAWLSPETPIQALEIAVDRVHWHEHRAENPSLETIHHDFSGWLREQGHSNPIRHNDAPAVAEQKAAELVQLRTTWQYFPTIYLRLPQPQSLDARRCWDELMRLGLQWMEDGHFHWVNLNNQAGGNSHFSVHLIGDPDLFVPETIASTAFPIQGLQFSFCFPHSLDPINVYLSMKAAAQHCSGRWGGTLTDRQGEKLSDITITDWLVKASRVLEKAGLAPGQERARRLF